MEKNIDMENEMATGVSLGFIGIRPSQIAGSQL